MAEAGGRARHIHRDVATADDDDTLAQIEVVAAEIDVDQEIDRAQHTVELFAFDVELAAGIGADADEDGIIFLAQIGHREVAAQRLIELKRGAQREDRFDFEIDQFARQSIFRHAEFQHAARYGRRLEDGDLVAEQSQIVGAGQSGWTRADNSDALPSFLAALEGRS